MKITNVLVATFVSASLALAMAVAQAGEHKGEKVDVKSLPAAVQKTIKEKAAGGEVVRVQREDDTNGKWNYEVIVKTGGKEWGFEVDPNGKFVKKTGEQGKKK
jgi:uncharacterized membrane protein YkoI